MEDKKLTYEKLLVEFEKLKENYARDLKIKEDEINALKQGIFKSEDTIDALPVGVVVYDDAGKMSHFNKYFIKLFGYKIEEIPNVSNWFPTVYPDEKYRAEISKKWFSSIDEYHITGQFTPVEARVKCKDGSYKDVEFGFETIGKTYLTTCVDLTQRKQAERAHLKAVEFNDDLINSLPAIFFMYGLSSNDALLVKWNKNHETRLGFTSEELYGKSIFDFFEGDDIAYITNSIKNLSEDFDLHAEADLVYADGTKHPYYFKAKSFTEAHQQFFYGIGIDISEQKKAEEALKESEEKYRRLYENANDAIFIMDGDVFFDCNTETLLMFDCTREQIIGKTPYDFSPPMQPDGFPSKERAIHLIKSALNRDIKVFEWLHTTQKRKEFYAEVSLSSLKLNDKTYIQAIVRNINERKLTQLELEKYKNKLEELVRNRTNELQTANKELKSTNEELYFVNDQLQKQKEVLSSTLEELKKTQSQLVETEKMASLGILTAGISHEINNPLNYIQAGIYSMQNLLFDKKEPFDSKDLKMIISHMSEGVKRVSKIVTSLNSFSKIELGKKRKCNIHKILENCMLVLKPELDENCTIETNFFDEKFGIIAEEGKLHHVFTNILINAMHAVKNKKGKIIVSTMLTGKGNLIQISIIDNGKGISKKNLEKIYDPFFTTKDPGKGTGLGLSIAFRIIKEHKGTIKYDSEINKGTKVLITLPIK